MLFSNKFLFLFVFSLMLQVITLSPVQAEEIKQVAEVPQGYIGVFTEADLNNIRNNLTGKYMLMSDIDLSLSTGKGGIYDNNGTGWEPIGTEAKPFSGVFDGNGYNITGMKIDIISDTNIHAGLFGYAKKAEIKNIGMVATDVKVENNSIYSTSSKAYAGGIAGNITDSTKIINAHNTGNIKAVSNFTSNAGGIVGGASRSTIKHSYNTGNVSGTTYVGGIAGSVEYDPSVISDSYNTGNITGDMYAGGITAFFSGTELVNNHNTGNVSANSRYAAGIAASTTNTVIKNSFNKGNIVGNYSGGIIGSLSTSTIQNSKNSGEIRTTTNSILSRAAGIAADASRSMIILSSNSGDIHGEGYYAGGIVGTLSNSTISQAFNEGTIRGNGSTAGGIVSNLYDSSSLSDSFNIGTVSAKYAAGGIVGRNSGSIKTSYNIAPVKVDSSVGNNGSITGTNEGTIIHSYHADEKGVGSGAEEGAVKTTFQKMKDKPTFEGFNFDSIWSIAGNAEYKLPQLIEINSPSVEKNVWLQVKDQPKKLVYGKGEDLDLTGAMITLRTNYGNVSDVAISRDMVSGFDADRTGRQTINVTFSGLSTTFEVSVLPKYTVVFKDCDGKEIKTEQVLEGSSATAPEIPEKPGYTFKNWDRSFSRVMLNFTVHARCDIDAYRVTFVDDKGRELKRQMVNHGSSATAPAYPDKPGYTFNGWDKDFSNITSELTVRATYKVSEYTVTFLDWNGKKLNVQTVKHGNPAKPPKKPSRTGHTFTGWDENFDKVTSDLTISAQYDPNLYTVTFKSYEGYTVETQYIHYGEAAIAPKSSKRTGYTFKGWDKNFSNVKSDLTVKELFTANKYTVSYKVDSQLILKQSVQYNTVATAPKNPTKKGYTFLGWYKDAKYKTKFNFNTGIKSNTTLYARLVKNTAKPSSIKAAPSGFNKVKVSWGKVSGASGYEIYRTASKSGKYSRIKTITKGSTASYTNSGLSTGRTYYYKIRAYKTVEGKKVYSPYTKVVTGKPALAKPSSITVKKATSTSINLSWKKTNEASGYQIYRSTTKKGSYKKIKTITKGSTTRYTNKSLTKGKIYYYKIRVYRTVNGKKVYSSYSNVTSCKL